MLSVILAIILFGTIVLIHELGHFLVAKKCGVKIDEFSIGMGPKIFSKRGADGTAYSLRLLPIGGYVSMAGEDEESFDPEGFCNKTKTQRLLILAAGAFMNILLGFLILTVTVSQGDIYSNKIESFLVSDGNGGVVEEFRGLLPGDEILSVGKMRASISYDYRFAAMRQSAEPCTLTVLRNGEKIKIENFTFPTTNQDGVTFGYPYFFMPETLSKTPFSVVKEAFFQTGSIVRMVVYSVYDIITGRYGTEAVSGPVGVVSEINTAAEAGTVSLLSLMAMITINVGVFNLLPFPALDGGRIIFLGIEALTKKRISPKVEGYINLAGLIILFGFMIFITFGDIAKLF